MDIKKELNHRIEGESGQPMNFDLFYPSGAETKPKPLVVFFHGYRENKHWGSWDLLGEEFVKQGFVFVKSNFSHNGADLETMEEFKRLDLFAKNRISMELSEGIRLLKHLSTWDKSFLYRQEPVHLVGHSRGGSIAILSEPHVDMNIKSVTAYAAPSSFSYFMPSKIKSLIWRLKKTVYLPHPRTGIDLPIEYGFYRDYQKNKALLDLKKAIQRSKVKHLLIYGTKDVVVPVFQGEELNKSGERTEFHILEGMDHNLGNKTPWEEDVLPGFQQEAFELTLKFIRS